MGRLPGPGALRRAAIVVGCAASLGLLPAAAAQAADGGTGPALSISSQQATDALVCSGDPTRGPEPVLLVPGTTLTPQEDFGSSYEPAFSAAGRAWCAVTLPDRGMADLQVAAEYVTASIRTLHARAGRPIGVVGHSQGGMLPRWSLKFWPDTRGMVADLVGLAPSNHGTLTAYAVCPPGIACQPAFAQQKTDSAFIKALNDGPETYAGIDYTVAFTRLDEVVTPNLDAASGSSSLRTGDGRRSNVAVQDVCPTDVSEHLLVGSVDDVGYQLAVDALDHDGPADPARVDRSTCASPFVPGLSPINAVANIVALAAAAAEQVALYPRQAGEPPLKPYVTAPAAAGESGTSAGTGSASAGTPTAPATGSAASGSPAPGAAAGAATSTGATAATARKPTFRLLTTVRRTARTGRARVLVSCVEACRGTLRLRLGGRTYGSRRYALATGSRIYVLRVGPKGRRALRGKQAARNVALAV